MQNRNNDCRISVRSEVYVILAAAALLLPIDWIAAWITAAVAHEFFHYIALKVCRCRISHIQIGANGTLMNAGTMSYGKEAFCAIAGPLGGFVLLLAARWLPKVAICGFVQSTYNLIPIYPMDGGRVLFSLLRKWCAVTIADGICKWTERIIICLLSFTCLYLAFAVSLGPIPVIWMAFLIFKNKFINSPCKDRLLRIQ